MTGNDDRDVAKEDEGSSGGGGPMAGAVLTILCAFPVAAVVALVYRFPIPFGGYQSGIGAMLVSPIAVGLYGVFAGGFVVLGLLGAVAGSLFQAEGDSKGRLIVAALTIDTIAIGLLSVWDKIYGPW